MKTIGLFIRSLNVGGAEKQSIILARKLAAHYQTKLIVIHKDGELIEQAQNSLRPEDLYFLNGKSLWAKGIDLYRYLRKNNIHSLICYLPSNNIMGIIAGKLAGVEKIYGGLMGAKIKTNRLKMFVQKFLLNRWASSVISNSFKARETYSAYGVRKDIIQVIHNGMDAEPRPLKRDVRDKVNIVSVGRFVEEKDYATALRAIKHLSSNGSTQSGVKFQYTIVGYGWLEPEIRSLISNLELSEVVDVKIKPPNIGHYYQSADIFLLTSVHEGTPNSVMEAMSWALPVVSTNAGDVSFLVRDGHNGFICDCGNHVQIADRLNKLINDPELRSSFGLNGYELLKQEFSTDVFLKKHIELIEA